MSEYREARASTGVAKITRIFERRDPHIDELRVARNNLLDRFQANLAAIKDGNWADVTPYQLPEYIPCQPTEYPIDLTRQDEFVSRQEEDFPHLPKKADVPGVVKLSLGDLDAGAEWDLFPVLDPTKRKRPMVDQARQRLENVRYHALLRRMFAVRKMYSDKMWQQVLAYKDANDLDWTELDRNADDISLQIPRVTLADVEQSTTSMSALAERLVFTMGARLGGRAKPPFRVFQARAGVDVYEHVDLILRVMPPQQEPTLVGFDITTKNDSVELWEKHLRQQGKGRSARSGTLRDPATLEQHLPVYREILPMPDGIKWQQVIEDWQQHRQRRQHSLITPEYFIQPEKRKRIVIHFMSQVKMPNGTKYYSSEVAQRLYQQLFEHDNTKALV